MFDFFDVMFFAITFVVGMMCLIPFFLVSALLYFGLFQNRTDIIDEQEEMSTPCDSSMWYRLFRILTYR